MNLKGLIDQYRSKVQALRDLHRQLESLEATDFQTAIRPAEESLEASLQAVLRHRCQSLNELQAKTALLLDEIQTLADTDPTIRNYCDTILRDISELGVRGTFVIDRG